MSAHIIVGSSGVINYETMPWLNAEVKPIDKKKNNMTNSVKVGFEIFAQYIDMVNDPYWKEIFKSASAGRLPRGVKLKGRNLVHNYKKKTSYVNITSGPYEIIKFLNKNLGIISKYDKIEENNKYNKFRIEASKKYYTDWNGIRGDPIKIQLVVSFCSQKQSELKLSNKEKNYLKTLILININSGNIKNENIRIENHFITEINNLIWDSSSRLFLIYKYNTYKIKSSIKVDPNIINPNNQSINNYKNKFNLNIFWSKYLDGLNKSNHITKESAPSSDIYFGNSINSTSYYSNSDNIPSNIYYSYPTNVSTPFLSP